MKPVHYILLPDNSVEAIQVFDENDVIIEEALIAWSEFFQDADRRRVGYDIIDDITVSTVFIGLDHSFDQGPPVLFETMVFEKGEEVYCRRYHSWTEAEKGHAQIVAFAKKDPETYSGSL